MCNEAFNSTKVTECSKPTLQYCTSDQQYCGSFIAKSDSDNSCPGGKKKCVVAEGCASKKQCKQIEDLSEILNKERKKYPGKKIPKTEYSCCKGDLCNSSGSLKQNFFVYVFVLAVFKVLF